MIFNDFLLALSQIGDRRFRGVLFKGIGLTLGLLFALYAATGFVANLLLPNTVTLPIIGQVTWVDDLVSWGSVLLMIGLSVFLMIPVASAFTSMFLDDVADAVEEQHYPALPPARHVGFAEGLSDTIRFLGIMVAANLVAFLIYAILLLMVVGAPLAPVVFWALNGYLLGREYFQLVAMRRLGRDGARAAFRQHLGVIWLAGSLMAVPLTVPILNLIIPVLGAATFTHLFHRLSTR